MKMKTGFTLIELLVVVLIIGILASVALPQYSKAVLKSRRVGAISIAKSVKTNMEAFFLANGKYPEYNEFADTVDFSGKTCTTSYPYRCRVGNYIMSYSRYTSGPTLVVMYAPQANGYSVGNSSIGGGFWANSDGSLGALCAYKGDIAQSICKSVPRTDKSGTATGDMGGYYYYHTTY